jgi:hypothetical protein
MWWWFRRLDAAEKRIAELEEKVKELDRRVQFAMKMACESKKG